MQLHERVVAAERRVTRAECALADCAARVARAGQHP